MSSEFHKKSFDNSTKTKLEFFNGYFQESFPVFIQSKTWDKIFIYDFFAGKGKDSKGEYGTSLGILNAISCHCQEIRVKKKDVYVILNDKEEHIALSSNVAEFLKECRGKCDSTENCILELNKNLIIKGNDFEKYFTEIYPKLISTKRSAKLIFIDPFGFVLNTDIFNKLTTLPSTDFICFMPSSYLRRFKDFSKFNEYIDTEKLNFDESLPEHCHREIANYFESLLPLDREYYFAYFSIRKGSNYYGLIFGSNHTLGAEKFLKICWEIDETTGEANYNIDREYCYEKKQDVLFSEYKIPLKLKKFNADLEERILSGHLKTDKEAYKFALKRRCQPKHASVIINALIKNGLVEKIKTHNNDIHRYDEQRFILK
jgi:three-Cys-motif partner protein